MRGTSQKAKASRLGRIFKLQHVSPQIPNHSAFAATQQKTCESFTCGYPVYLAPRTLPSLHQFFRGHVDAQFHGLVFPGVGSGLHSIHFSTSPDMDAVNRPTSEPREHFSEISPRNAAAVTCETREPQQPQLRGCFWRTTYDTGTDCQI